MDKIVVICRMKPTRKSGTYNTVSDLRAPPTAPNTFNLQ